MGQFISLADQSYFSPGPVMQDSVRQSIANTLARQQQQQQQQQFQTEQAVRQAQAAPQIDPSTVQSNVGAAKSAAASKASDAATIAAMPMNLRRAYLAGRIPQNTTTSTSISPGGGTVQRTQDQIPTGNTGPDGQPEMTPFGGSTNTSAPPVRTTTKILPPAPGQAQTPGLAMVQTDSYVLKDPSKPDTEDNRQIVDTKQAPQRTTPPRGDAAILEFAENMGVDPDDVKNMVQGLINKKSATGPADPNAMKPTAEWAQNNVNLVKLNAQLRQTDPNDAATRGQLQDQIQKLTDRNKFLSTPKKTSGDALEALLSDNGSAQPDANGNSKGSEMPAEQAGKIAAARAAQPSDGANGGPPRPAAPATTGKTANPGAEAQQFVDGKTYTDKLGRKAKWSSAQNKFVTLTPAQ